VTTAKVDNVTRGLHAKLAEVMAEAERIPKNGTYSGQGGFKYVLVGDAADAIRTALAARKVSMLPSAVEVVSEAEHETRSGGTMTTLTIRTTWTLVDGETGETAVIQSIGTGADAGDKASPKAQTNAMKYALLMGFLLSTGDDPEQSDSSDRRPRADEETAELIGIDTVSGVIKKGEADKYLAEWRESPAGPVIGFALKRNGDRDMPQVGLMGDIAKGLQATGDFPTGAELIGQKVSLKGRFYAVRIKKGWQPFTRVIVGQGDNDYIEVGDWRIPPKPEDAVPLAEGQESLPFDASLSAAVDEEEATRQGETVAT
jgi:ERF superfamily protein